MGEGTLTIYSSSAGSGKTFQLTVAYLTRLFISPGSYRRILAVTFTNKATAEMKERILGQLDIVARGDPTEYLAELVRNTGKSEEMIRIEARAILRNILNDYARFQVSTIDSFFQKILRAFARETGLHSGFSVELDHNVILSEAIDNTIASASEDTTLRNWLINYVKSNLEEEKGWNLKNEIAALSGELFREKYKTLTPEEKSALSDKQLLADYISSMRSVMSEFEDALKNFGTKSMALYIDFNLSDDMFYFKQKGVPLLISNLASGDVKAPNSYAREILKDPARWCTGSMHPRLYAALEAGLEELLVSAIVYFDDNIRYYRSARAVLANIFSLGILSDVLNNVRKIISEENTFLLADTGEFINRIIAGDQTPFIYEKTGSRFENYMIDEFQDTSVIQWENFRPLIENSMSEGFDNLIVGDVKQSIYRWRNSNWRILGFDLRKKANQERHLLRSLDTNFRSLSNIITFNNLLFSGIPRNMDQEFNSTSVPATFTELYSESFQKDPGRAGGGYVRLEFVDDNELKWKESVLEILPTVIEKLQDIGYRSSDIGIIVRNNREGADVIKRIIDHSNKVNQSTREKYNYNVISNDSLLLDKSFAVTFLLAVLAVLNEPEDMISKALMLRYYLLATGKSDAEDTPLISDKLDEISGNHFPDGYEYFMQQVRIYPLFEMCERITGFFGLDNYPDHAVYLNAFQDLTLTFAGSRSSGIQPFLDWWESTGSNKSVVLPEYHDAMRVLTIHKAKGLEFRVVILPFISWNLDHVSNKQPVLWVRPAVPPFNTTGIVPVRYRQELEDTIFEDDYLDEKYSTYIDNINLLYVALTRAKDVIYGFAPAVPRAGNGIAKVLADAIRSVPELFASYDEERKILEFGEMAPVTEKPEAEPGFEVPGYPVNFGMQSLKLKLQGEDYFLPEAETKRDRINYGRQMHKVFQEIITPGDVGKAVEKLVIEGIISEKDASNLKKRIELLLRSPDVSEWFSSENTVLTEQPILLPSGTTRRPDRIILRNEKVTIVDFKFGEEDQHHVTQISYYRRLMEEMGYKDIRSFLWYVDENKIRSV